MAKLEIHSFIQEASKLRIAVVGDLIVDKYIFGNVIRISPEGPIPIVNVTGTRENQGGAGNVVENLRGLGCEVSSFYGKHVPIKTRVMSGNHHVIRIDEEEEPYWMTYDEYDIGLDYGIQKCKFDCVIISDYGKGAISRDVASKLIRTCNNADIPIVVDTKRQHNIFFSATTIKSNRKEYDAFWESRRKDFDDQWAYMKCGDINNMVITNGDKGMEYYGHDGSLELSGYVPGLKTEICDPCGAGDTVTAILGVSQAIGMPIDKACELANIAASEVCRHAGVHAINKEELIRRFNEVQL